VGVAIALAIALVRGEAIPSSADVGWAIAGGVAGGVGITALYRGLAIGRMGIVAPVTGLLAAVIPVVAGVILEGLPPALVVIGIVLAVAAVVLVSRVADESGSRAGMPEALLAGTGFGLFVVLIAQVSDGLVFGPLTIVRLTEAALLGGLILVTRTRWRPPRSLLPIIVAAGVLDMAGNASYILAVQTGALAVAAVLSALYPVVTVILATLILHERVTREHATGIALAALAIVCIGVGSA
jgi:drug/metabolite transporter (DMT)-like permease